MAEQKRRGRPEVDNQTVLDEVMKNAETRKKFKERLDVLVQNKKNLIYENECYSEDVSAVAKDYGLNKGFISEIVDARAKNKESIVISNNRGVVEVLEQIYSENGDE